MNNLVFFSYYILIQSICALLIFYLQEKCCPYVVLLTTAGYYISPGNPDAGPALTGWRIHRWESGTKPVNIHPLLESTNGPPPTMTTWTSVAKQNITRGRFSKNSHFQQKHCERERPVNPRAIARIVFSAHGGELAVALFSGEVHVFSGESI